MAEEPPDRGEFLTLALAEFAVEIAATDCETIHPGVLAQPVNALTSLSYAGAGLALIVQGLRRGRQGGKGEVLYGSTLVAIGLGSFAFHGPQPTGAQFLHDVPIAAALLYIALHNLDRVGLIRNPRKLFLWGLVPVLGVFVVAPTLAQVIAAALAGVAIISELIVYRSTDDSRLRRLDLAAALLLGLAGVGYVFGKSGSVLCDPGSLWQAHGAWHALSAAAFMVWGLAAFGDPKTRHIHMNLTRPR